VLCNFFIHTAVSQNQIVKNCKNSSVEKD